MSKYLFKISQLEKYKNFVDRLLGGKHAIILQSDDELLLDAIYKFLIMKYECLDKNKPCFICSNCQKILDETAVDVELFGKEKNILVEDSQKIVEDSFVLPLEFKSKYFVLNNFENATVQAQNKLLKIIEEPREFDKFILLVSNLNQVLPTIKSRCEIFSIPKFDNVELQKIFDYKLNEGDKFNFACQYSNGNLTTLNNIFYDEKFVEIYNLCRKILTEMRNSSFVLEFSSNIIKNKDRIDTFFEILTSLYMDILYIKEGKTNLVKNQKIINELLVLSNEMNELAVLNIIKEIQLASQKITSNANFAGVIDNLLLKILEIKHLCK